MIAYRMPLQCATCRKLSVVMTANILKFLAATENVEWHDLELYTQTIIAAEEKGKIQKITAMLKGGAK